MFDHNKKHDPADFYGVARKCQVCLPAVNIHHNFCQTCFNRGYVAVCTSCDGKGMATESTPWGNKSTMESKCHWCGGKGFFAVTKEYYEAHRNPEEVDRPEPQMPQMAEKSGQQDLLKSTTL